MAKKGDDKTSEGDSKSKDGDEIPEQAPAPNPNPSSSISIVDFDTEMKKSYLDYSMSVIVGRALPDVRDGLKPVHRRVIYGMYNGHYYMDRNSNKKQYYKCARVVGDVMGNFHPHGDASIYDALVRLAQNWNLRYTLIEGQGNFGSRGESHAAAMRYTECLMGKLGHEMIRDIDKETVNFEPTYDGRGEEPTVLPARFPNLLVNGSSGIAVGMATNIPTHNLIEVANGVKWYLENSELPKDQILAGIMQHIKGPDFPTGALIVGSSGIRKAYETGRGSVTMRAVVESDEKEIIVRELPYQVNPDQLLERMEDLIKNDVIGGVSAVHDLSSSRTGLNIVITLKKGASALVVLNNLYKHTALQTTFGCNMLALVDGVPKTLSIDMFIKYWVEHQHEIIQRRSLYIQKRAQARAHILDGYLLALDKIDAVIKLIRGSKDVETARTGLMKLLKIDEEQSKAILAMQLSRLAALEHQKIKDEHKELQDLIADMQNILESPLRQKTIIRDELDEIVKEFGDERRTQIIPGEDAIEDEALIKVEDIVVTFSNDGFIKRTNLDLYRSQHRGGKGVQGAKLREDDIIQNFFATSTHDFLLMFTNTGRVFRIKGYEIPNAGRDTKGQHIANFLALGDGEKIVEILDIKDFEAAKYLVIATRGGKVKKSLLSEYNTNRTGGLKAINLVDDEVVAAKLLNDEDLVLLVSRNGQAVKFKSSEKQLRSMGRSTAGVRGMRFKGDDELLTADVIEPESDVLIVTENGFAKRSNEVDYRETNRGGTGVKVASFDDKRGKLVGAIIVDDSDELLVIMASGKIVRSKVAEIRTTGRASKGVVLAKTGDEDKIVEITKTPKGGDDGPEPGTDG